MIKLLTCVYLSLLVGPAKAQPDSSVLVFRRANVIDGFSDKPLNDVTVTVTNGKITGINKGTKSVPSNAIVIDLNGKWLMPGYIDAHVHFGNTKAAQTALSLGATTVRTMHCDRFLDIQIREAHRSGQRDLPDVIAAGYQMRPDMFPTFFEDFPALADMKPRVTGTENVRRVVRALVSRGVDHIKFLATERAGTPETDPRKRTFTDEEIAAIVDEAGKAGLAASAHAHGDEGAYAAVKAGVKSIEHGTFITDSTISLMKKNKTFFVPTFTGGAQQPSRPEDRDNPILQERRRIGIPLRNKLTVQFFRLGIPMAGGTDLRYMTTELSMADEALYFQKAGLSPMKILQIITSGSAKCLGIDNRTGTIRKGMEADLIVLGANPLESLEALKDIRLIVNNGKLVANKLLEGLRPPKPTKEKARLR
ncbi:MAG TPA: amidohydrolase family protein [Chitinophagaceae bacterium]